MTWLLNGAKSRRVGQRLLASRCLQLFRAFFGCTNASVGACSKELRTVITILVSSCRAQVNSGMIAACCRCCRLLLVKQPVKVVCSIRRRCSLPVVECGSLEADPRYFRMSGSGDSDAKLRKIGQLEARLAMCLVRCTASESNLNFPPSLEVQTDPVWL